MSLFSTEEIKLDLFAFQRINKSSVSPLIYWDALKAYLCVSLRRYKKKRNNSGNGKNTLADNMMQAELLFVANPNKDTQTVWLHSQEQCAKVAIKKA